MTEVISRPTEARATQAIDQWASNYEVKPESKKLTLAECIAVFRLKRKVRKQREHLYR